MADWAQVWRVTVDGVAFALTTQRLSNANIKRRKLNAQVRGVAECARWQGRHGGGELR